MALTGHLSDLSLSELIEFFCNQRKTGRLKVLYPGGAGYFYLQTGSVVDARIGVLNGCDAVYYALTLPNAEFEFHVDAECENRSINQPWTQVVLEGLRRLDESISPGEAFPPGFIPEPDELAETKPAVAVSSDDDDMSGFFATVGRDTGSSRKPLFIGAIAVAVLGSVAAIGVPAGWYHKAKPAQATAAVATPVPQSTQAETPQPQPESSASTSPTEDPGAARRLQQQREKDKKARDTKNAPENVAAQPAPASNGKRVTVTVTYDEAGRVTSTSGGDANAMRIARQKRFPAGKAGSATVSIPIN
jgi:hypothetical protein